MNLLQRYVSHGIAIGLLVFIMLAFNLSVLAQTSEKRVLRVAFPQVDGMSWTAEDGTHHGMLVDYLNEIAKIYRLGIRVHRYEGTGYVE